MNRTAAGLLTVTLLTAPMVAACGSGTPAAGPTSASAAPTTTTSATTATPTTTTTSSKYSHEQQLFLEVMRNKGVLTTPSTSTSETLVLSQGDLYCRMLGEGLSRQQIFANAGLSGSAARARTELIFFDAVVALCPQHSALATQ